MCPFADECAWGQKVNKLNEDKNELLLIVA